MKPVLSLFFVFVAYFAQAQTNFHRHEVVVGTGLPFSLHAGYRYHFTDRLAARATLHSWGYSNASKWSNDYYGITTPKIGMQWATSTAPFHALLMADIAVPLTDEQSSSSHYDYNPLVGHRYKTNTKGVGIGLSAGIGAEWLIKNRVALQLYAQPTFSYIWEQGITEHLESSATANNRSEITYKKDYFKTYGDILAFSVSYRFL